MVTTLVLTLLAAAPQVGLVERSTLGLTSAQGALVRTRLAKALVGSGLDAELLDGACSDSACLLARAQTRGSCVVGVTLVKNKKGLTVDLEAVHQGAVVVQQTFLLLSEKGVEQSPEAQVFAYQLATKLQRSDAPVSEPKPTAQVDRAVRPEVVVTPVWAETKPASPRVPLLVASGSVAAVGVALVVVSAVVKGSLDAKLAQTPVVTTLTRAQAQADADVANGLLVGGLVGLGVGLAGGATALVF